MPRPKRVAEDINRITAERAVETVGQIANPSYKRCRRLRVNAPLGRVAISRLTPRLPLDPRPRPLTQERLP